MQQNEVGDANELNTRGSLLGLPRELGKMASGVARASSHSCQEPTLTTSKGSLAAGQARCESVHFQSIVNFTH